MSTVSPNLIPLTRGGNVVAYALVDAADFDALAARRWRLHPRGYAATDTIDGCVLMHRQLVGLESGNPLEVDHVNRVKTDNRRCNLRVVTHAENTANHPGHNGASGVRGVFPTPSGKFVARVRIQGRLRTVGTYASAERAAEAVDAYRIAHMPGALPEMDRAA